MLPNFICPGTQKAATSTLYNILNQHPDIYLPKKKETHFFDREERFSQGIDWYQEQYYGDVADETVIGDMTPEYMYLSHIPQRIMDCLGPDIKFIFMLRNPVDRAFSHYQMSVRRGWEKYPLKKAIKLEEERVSRGPAEARNFSYIGRGYYALQVERFLALFPRENMKFVLFEDFIGNMPETVGDILRFLGVEPCPMDYRIKSNSAWEPKHPLFTKVKKTMQSLMPEPLKKYVPDHMKRKWLHLDKKKSNKKIDPALRLQLTDMYADDIKKLEGLTGKDLSNWLTAGSA